MNLSKLIRSRQILENEMLYDKASTVKYATDLVYDVFSKDSDFKNVKKGISKVSFYTKENVTITLSINTEEKFTA
jgi:hypothetical protein